MSGRIRLLSVLTSSDESTFKPTLPCWTQIPTMQFFTSMPLPPEALDRMWGPGPPSASSTLRPTPLFQVCLKLMKSSLVLLLCLQQIVAQPKHEFSSCALYQNVTLLAWDPALYSSNLSQVHPPSLKHLPSLKLSGLSRIECV